MMKTKPDTAELEPTNGVERPPREGRSVEGGSGTSIRRPTCKQLERSLIGTYNEAVKYELRRNVRTRVGNKTEELPVIEAIVRLVSDAALNGDFLAQRELLALYRAERSRAIKSKQPEYDLNLLSKDELDELDTLLAKASPIRC